jgi:hypothetical protein
MRIRDWGVTTKSGVVEVAAEVDGFRLWYRLPESFAVTRSADPFVAAALLPAMVRGEELVVDEALAVSPRLLRNIARLQEIFHCWNPALTQVAITATPSPAEPLRPDAFSFFSGGVDSTYTFLKHVDDISHVVFIHGFDFFDQSAAYNTAVERNARFVAGYGKKLIPVETNFYTFGYRYAMSRNLSQGGCLASVALLLGFATAYVPASLVYNELEPLGSHPLTDPLWSNEAVELVHDGCEARRTDKLRVIAASEAALNNLRVCFVDMNVNCGRCTKCLRTMVPLELLGAKAAPFPHLPALDTFMKGRVENETERWALQENFALALAEDAPQHRELREAMRKRLRRAETRRAVRDLDRVILDGWMRRTFVKAVPVRSIGTTPEP